METEIIDFLKTCDIKILENLLKERTDFKKNHQDKLKLQIIKIFSFKKIYQSYESCKRLGNFK